MPAETWSSAVVQFFGPGTVVEVLVVAAAVVVVVDCEEDGVPLLHAARPKAMAATPAATSIRFSNRVRTFHPHSARRHADASGTADATRHVRGEGGSATLRVSSMRAVVSGSGEPTADAGAGRSQPVDAVVPAARHRPQLEAHWTDDQTVRVGDTTFRVRNQLDDLHREMSEPDDFLLAKERGLLTTILDAAPSPVRNMVELGVFKGGSVAFYSLVLAPSRLVAVDRYDFAPALGPFIDRQGLGDIVRPYLSVDQSDGAALLEIMEANFEERSVDLVIDDCSHLYGPTKASFNVLFGWLRPGGVYIIEDWAWAHWAGEPWQGSEPVFDPDEPALSNFIYELAMLSASRPDLVSEVRVGPSYVIVERGAGEVGKGFDISSSYFTRGRGFDPRM